MANADGNVPFVGPRARYSILGVQPTLLRHQGTIDGKRPATAAKPDPDDLDPSVSGGRAEWLNLTHGGVFDLLANRKAPVIVESVEGGTATIIDRDDMDAVSPTSVRATPGSTPWKLLPGECLRFASGSDIKVVVRLDAQRVL